MTALEALWLDGTRLGDDLNRLKALPKLRHLSLHVRGVTDYSPVNALVELDSLEIGFDRVDDLGHLDEIDWEKLSGLRSLTILGDKPYDIGRPYDLGFVAQVSGLRDLEVSGLRPHDGRPRLPLRVARATAPATAVDVEGSNG